MSHLQRIILIHAHLDGVVELNLDGHTNICGTNASGKTTLQRLIPVFYGELPNRVVPKTRKKFDDFYLPNSNSYLIYEYQREEGDLCQAVLTRKKEGGVDYRFVKGAYQPEHYLVLEAEGVRGLNYSDWASQLRQQQISFSSKLTSTSEFRSIIQNDFSLLRGSRNEGLRLRQLAAQYSLVKQTHRIRHMEKLVAAVHAKEGKMDTLKTMLAAIFEEDGVELPVTGIRNTKAKEWIQQMRQSMRLEKLQAEFAQLNRDAQQLAANETELWQLQPLLEKDASELERSRADNEALLNQLSRDLNQQQQAYEEARLDWQDQLSEERSQLAQIERELDDLQERYDGFAERDLPRLEADLQRLPEWRLSQEELQKHLQLMRDQLGDSQQKLEARKLELSQEIEQQAQGTYQRIEQLQIKKEQERERQEEEKARQQQDYEQQLLKQQDAFQEQLDGLTDQLAEARAGLQVGLLTAQEQQGLELAQARLDQAQVKRQDQTATQDNLRQQLEASKQERQATLDQLNRVRQELAQVKARCRQLHRQRDPEQGSLRHFLRFHQPGWEQTLGKVLRAELLERQDLSPQTLNNDPGGLFNLQLDLAAIELPDFAQEEAALLVAIQEAEDKQQQLDAEQELIEKRLLEKNRQVEIQQQNFEQSRLAVQAAENEINFALDTRNRLVEELRQLEKDRQQQRQKELGQLQERKQRLLQERERSLKQLKQDYQAQQLEFRADWQEELASWDRQIQALQEQLQSKRQEHQRQLAELEAAFNQELEEKQLDPRHLREAQARLTQLTAAIRTTSSRKEELEDYQKFMRVDWAKRKPELLLKETQLKQREREAEQALEALKASYQTERSQIKQRIQELQAQREHQQRQLNQLHPLLSRLESLVAPEQAPAAAHTALDLTERIDRAQIALNENERLTGQLKRALEDFEGHLIKDASSDFIDYLDAEREQLEAHSAAPIPPQQLLPVLAGMLKLLEDQQQQLLQQGRNLGEDLSKFFTVFRDLNLRINEQSRRLSREVADDLLLEGISKSEVKIQSTIDELGFWKPLRHFAALYEQWRHASDSLPSNDYLNALADVVDLLRSDQSYSFESLLRLELHLNEGGTDLVIKNDRQLLESSSHGMAYLILCKFLLAFTRLLRGPAQIAIHWPIDEIGTLAYHNVEKLFNACESNRIHIVGAFPNPESDVLALFQHRYLIDRDRKNPQRRQLKRIEPQLSRLAERLQARQQEVSS